ncbi:MAG TPA: hypothetical protein VLB84_11050 [Bacteroidia bacterium]|nr:hypothetical protein [Bacteroidia bacterium]
MNTNKNILDLQDELKEMPQFKTLEIIRHFNHSIKVFTGNFRQLQELLEFHNDPIKSQELHTVINRELLYEFHNEIARLLHNYVASAFSLIDHTRIHYNKLYKSDGKFPDYESEVKKIFIDDPLANFIKDLRRFVQHYKLPEISSNTVFKTNPPEFKRTLKLKKEDLMKFDWNSKSTLFLNQNNDDIDLLLLINKYYEKVSGFYKWFTDRQNEIHQEDIVVVENKKDEIRKIAIPDLIVAALSFPENSVSHFEGAIFSIFNLLEQNEINSISDKERRCEKLLEVINSKVEIAFNIKNKIISLYKKAKN